MNFLDDISRDTLIICESDNKKKILNKINECKKLIPVKFISLKELYNLYYFNYDEKALYYLINKYNFKYDVAKTYLDNLIYIENTEFRSDKLNDLKNIKKELERNDIIKKNENFIHDINNKDIIFYGYDYIDKFTLKLIDSIKKITNIKIIEKKYDDYKHKAYEFAHIEDEVDFVASKICSLIKNGIDINKIKISNIDDEYKPIIKRVFYFYNIPINLDDEETLYSTIPASFLIKNFNSDLSDIIEKLKEKYNPSVVNQIINIINKYTFVSDKLLVKDMIIHDLLNTKVIKTKFVNAINIIDYKNYSNNDYVFLMNFNQKSIPVTHKDEKYLSDNDLKLLDLETSVELNKIDKNIAINNIKSIKNLIITYKKESYSSEYYPSNLINEMNLEVVTENTTLDNSHLSNKIKLCKYLDDYYKYNIKNPDMDTLLNNYDLPYKNYDNKYNLINRNTLEKLINNKLNLSYSSMQSYNECSFKYYIQNILKLDVYEDKFSSYIGTLFHHILEIGINKEINVKEEIDKFIIDRKFNNKEKYYIEKLTKDIEFALNVIKKQLDYTKFNKIITENKLVVIKNRNISVTFKGFIDKMMTYNDGVKTLVALIDYKTYDVDLKMDLIDYGLNLQLPIYLYLAGNNLETVEFAGFYIQKVLPSEKKYNKDKTLEEQTCENMKLCGYSNSDEHILKLFDRTYESSEIIKGMKIKNDGNFSSSSHVLNTKQMDMIISKVDDQINKCIDNIDSCNFNINPKNINNNNISCKFCKYRDLCYMTQKDIEEITVQEVETDEMDE